MPNKLNIFFHNLISHFFFKRCVLFFLILLLGYFLYQTYLNHFTFKVKTYTEKNYDDTRYLIVTADDFSANDFIDSGIYEGIENGIINTVSAFINYENSPDKLIALYATFPEISIGLHLNITSGIPVSSQAEITSITNNGYFFTIDEIYKSLSKISLDEVEIELRNQIDLFISTGIKLDHLSSQHNIIAIYPPFFNILIKLAKEYNVPIRYPIPISTEFKSLFGYSETQKLAKKKALRFFINNPIKAIGVLKQINPGTLKKLEGDIISNGILSPDHMIDVIYNSPSPHNFFYTINNLPEGVSEIIFHLGKGKYGIEQYGIDYDYYPVREQELILCTSPTIKSYLKTKNIEFFKYSDLKSINN